MCTVGLLCLLGIRVDSWAKVKFAEADVRGAKKASGAADPKIFRKLGVGDPKMIQYDSYDHETIGIMIRNQNYIDNDDQPSDSWGSAFLKLRS
jgi:hypothetical protein